jgi:pSer/pThr/pTyr-binding forkhead associated (FHA) protein
MAEWVILSKNRVIKRFKIVEGQCLAIGRGDDADVLINNSSISRKHTSLELNKGFYYLNDLHSMNGTWVNGEKISAERQIFELDDISFGKFTLKPAKLLTGAEVEAGSIATDGMNMENHNQTLYVTAIRKPEKNAAAAPRNRLSVLQGYATPAKLILKGKTITAGKDPSANLVIPGALMAKSAFTIEYRTDGYFVVPQGGLFNKVILNGKKIDKVKRLKPMDVIEVGKTKIRFS